MKNTLILIGCIILVFSSCGIKHKDAPIKETNQEQNIRLFKSTLLKHLNAVSDKDLASLKSTMSPKGNMELILPSSEIIYSVDAFMKYHQEWFKIPNWTFETKLISTKVGNKIGVATTEILYKEPERNGKPYFNRMTVTYVLERINGNWYIIKDHASSVEKTNPP